MKDKELKMILNWAIISAEKALLEWERSPSPYKQERVTEINLNLKTMYKELEKIKVE